MPNFCSTGGAVAPIILPLSRGGGPGAGRLPDDQNQRSERIADFGDNGLWSEDADMEALGLALDSNEVEPEDAPLVGSPRLNSPRQNNAARRPGDGSPPARQRRGFLGGMLRGRGERGRGGDSGGGGEGAAPGAPATRGPVIPASEWRRGVGVPAAGTRLSGSSSGVGEEGELFPAIAVSPRLQGVASLDSRGARATDAAGYGAGAPRARGSGGLCGGGGSGRREWWEDGGEGALPASRAVEVARLGGRSFVKDLVVRDLAALVAHEEKRCAAQRAQASARRRSARQGGEDGSGEGKGGEAKGGESKAGGEGDEHGSPLHLDGRDSPELREAASHFSYPATSRAAVAKLRSRGYATLDDLLDR